MSLRRAPRTASLIALAALAAHQLRYALAFGGEASHELAAQGHGYLSQSVPVLVAFALAGVLASVAGAALGPRPAPGARGVRGAGGDAESGFARRAAAFGVAVFLVYAAQELVEGVLVAGHPAGLAGVFGAGGWLALPLAALAGFGCALLDRGVDRLERAASGLRLRRRRLRAPRSFRRPRPAPEAQVLSPLARGIASRPPPLLAG